MRCEIVGCKNDYFLNLQLDDINSNKSLTLRVCLEHLFEFRRKKLIRFKNNDYIITTRFD